MPSNRHSREGGNPLTPKKTWTPAFAGVTVGISYRTDRLMLDSRPVQAGGRLCTGVTDLFSWLLCGLTGHGDFRVEPALAPSRGRKSTGCRWMPEPAPDSTRGKPGMTCRQASWTRMRSPCLCWLNAVNDGKTRSCQYRSPYGAYLKRCATSWRRVRRCSANRCRNSCAASWNGLPRVRRSASGSRPFACAKTRREPVCHQQASCKPAMRTGRESRPGCVRARGGARRCRPGGAAGGGRGGRSPRLPALDPGRQAQPSQWSRL